MVLRRHAAWLHGEVGGWVTPVLCLVQRDDRPHRRDGVWIMGVDQLAGWLRARTPPRGAHSSEGVTGPRGGAGSLCSSQAVAQSQRHAPRTLHGASESLGSSWSLWVLALLDMAAASPLLWRALGADLIASTSESLSVRDDVTPLSSSEIVSATRSGGANTSHTIVVPALRQLLKAVPTDADLQSTSAPRSSTTSSARTRLERASERSDTSGSSICSVLTRSCSARFEISGQTILEASHSSPALCALARDAVFRASAGAIFESDPGDALTNGDFADAVAHVYPDVYNEPTLAKIGRNTFSSWEQTGHLEPSGKHEKVRRRPTCTPSTTAYALMLGHLEGVRGEALFDTFWARVLDQPRSHLFELASVASQRSLIDFRRSGGITEVGFTELLRPLEGQLA